MHATHQHSRVYDFIYIFDTACKSTTSFARIASGPEGWTQLKMDVTDEASVQGVIDEIVRREGRIDAIVSCAGVSAGLMCPDSATSAGVRSPARRT